MPPRRKFSGPSPHPRFELSYRFVAPKLRQRRTAHISSSAVHSSILTIFRSLGTKDNHHISPFPAPFPVDAKLDWYLLWLEQQLYSLPNCIIKLIAGDGAIEDVNLCPNSALFRIFMDVNVYVRQNSGASIDEIIDYLCASAVLESTEDQASFQTQRLLIFTILGWQSMLYLPSFNTCTLDELAIHQEIDQPNSGLVFDTFKLSADFADRPMSILLKAYGNLLPARPRGLWDGPRDCGMDGKSWRPLPPSEVNAHTLHALLRVEMRWVDTLAHHLDYDKSTKTLSLFRHPSFCLGMLQSRGALFSFASTEQSPLDPRASDGDIQSILTETLLSYRFLFGQSQKSRKFFRRLARSDATLSGNFDPLLSSLCAEKLFAHPLVPRDRLNYCLHRDFPILGARVELLAGDLKGAKPTGWKDMLRDRRDKVQYWTFWLVAMIGAIGILLAATQVILQAVQIANS